MRYKQVVLNENAIGILDDIRYNMPLRGNQVASYSQAVNRMYERLQAVTEEERIWRAEHEKNSN